jgi:isopenicillin-N epimerase
LYARPEMQHLLKPLVVSWGYEPEMPGASAFVDQHEWWGTRDIAAFLSVPTAIKFQEKNHWDKVRITCHELAQNAQQRICELTGLAPLHASAGNWFAQLTAAPLPVDTNLAALKARLYDEHHIEVPLIAWKDMKLIRVSIQGYNSKRDVDHLLKALTLLLVKNM